MSQDPEKAMEEDEMEGEEEDDLKQKVLQNPALLSVLQGKLNSMVGAQSGYVQSLPAPVKRRLKALKKLQFECTKIEAKFYEEVHKLECKYHELYRPFFEQRVKVTSGEHEPDDQECEWPSDEEDEELAEEVCQKVKLTEEEQKKKDEEDKNVKGVPEFWLTIFKNVDLIQEMVQEHDEPILAKLTDITMTFSEQPMGFTLHFHFAPNEYFTNSVLTKQYMMKCEPDEEDPFSFDGAQINRCVGCTIDWKPGKNITVKTVKKKQKHKSKGAVRTITKQVKNDSFFNFFDPPAIPEDPKTDVDVETQELLTADFEIGHYLRERIVPRAVLYFTGEALDEFEEEEEEEDDDDDDDEEKGEEEEDEDPDFDPSKGQKGADCKQQ